MDATFDGIIRQQDYSDWWLKFVPKTCTWTDLNILRFLEKYKAEEILWDCTHPNYLNPDIRIATYHKITKELKLTGLGTKHCIKLVKLLKKVFAELNRQKTIQKYSLLTVPIWFTVLKELVQEAKKKLILCRRFPNDPFGCHCSSQLKLKSLCSCDLSKASNSKGVGTCTRDDTSKDKENVEKDGFPDLDSCLCKSDTKSIVPIDTKSTKIRKKKCQGFRVMKNSQEFQKEGLFLETDKPNGLVVELTHRYIINELEERVEKIKSPIHLKYKDSKSFKIYTSQLVL